MEDRTTVMSWLEGLAQDNWVMFHSDSEVQEIARNALELLKKHEAREQCIKPKCIVCPHCANCDVNESGLLKEQEPKWISVKDRLPEICRAVLAYSPRYKNIWVVTMEENGKWYYWSPTAKKYDSEWEGPITHWMPLPGIPDDEK